MTVKLHVGNLSAETTNEDLKRLFAQYGTVFSAEVVTRRLSGISKGFAFVELTTDDEAQAAIAALHGNDFAGNAITVEAARPRERRVTPGYGGYQGGGRGRSRDW